ncbi:MAG: hypothetical protein EA427_13420 [Spirochaetaceae bacterium]|nr:MAG: hypothetical protein EA427_13420 [Spirochaetaceae bacterium]
MKTRIRVFSSEASAAAALRKELVETLTAPPEMGPRVIMLAGGATPIEVYGQIAEDPPDGVAPGTWLLLSDDRHVPPEDDRSNYGKIHPMAVSLGIPDTRMIHPDPELDLAEAASDLGMRIASAARSGADFDLGILGIGADGHTASIFWPNSVPVDISFDEADAPGSGIGSGTPRYSSADELALAAGEHLGIERVSVSAAVLLAFRRLIFFVTGSAKRDILKRLINAPGEFPAGRILMQHPGAEIWTDQHLGGSSEG